MTVPATESFDDAFTALVIPDITTPVTTPAPEAPAPEPTPEPTPAPEAAAPAVEATETPEPEPTPEPAPAPDAKTDDDPVTLEQLQRLLKAAGTAGAEAAAAAKPEAPRTETPAEQEPLTLQYTDEEKEILSKYDTDWPDVSRAETIKRAAEYKVLAKYLLGEVAAAVMPKLQLLDAVVQHVQLASLESQVPDYNDVQDKVIDWVAKQPPVLRKAYEDVIDHGTSDDVVFLINAWRTAEGAAPAATKTPAPTKKKADTELPAATKQAIADLAPVSTKRSAAQAPVVDAEDFDSAFKTFASA